MGGSLSIASLKRIHETDLNRLCERALTDPAMQGVYIACSPHPVSQRDFMRTLRKAVGMPIGLPAASWMVRLAAPWLLKTDPELALYGRYVISRRLKEEGFEFQFPELDAALADIVKSGVNRGDAEGAEKGVSREGSKSRSSPRKRRKFTIEF